MEKIKQFVETEQGKGILSILVIILVALGSFGLGRLSRDQVGPGIAVQEYNLANVINAVENTTTNNTKQNIIKPTETTKSISAGKSFFASSRGSKYYSIGCSGGKTLKEENKVWFSTKQEAENAGYELSSTCK